MSDETPSDPWFLPDTEEPVALQIRAILYDLVERVTESRDERGYRRFTMDDETYFQLGMLCGGLARLIAENPGLVDE